MRQTPLLGGANALGSAGMITLPALLADSRVEGRAATFLRRLPAFAPYLGVELGAMLAAHTCHRLFFLCGRRTRPHTSRAPRDLHAAPPRCRRLDLACDLVVRDVPPWSRSFRRLRAALALVSFAVIALRAAHHTHPQRTKRGARIANKTDDPLHGLHNSGCHLASLGAHLIAR